MATKQTTKKTSTRKAPTKSTAVKSKPASHATRKKSSAAPKKRVAASSASTKIDYYPNRMTVAVSALAGSILVLFAVIAVLGSY